MANTLHCVTFGDRGGSTVRWTSANGCVARRRAPTPARPRGTTAFSQQALVTRPALVNGVAGWVTFRDGDVFSIAALTQRNGRITAIDVLSEPVRLGRVDLAGFDA
jgi:hypothetical protein